jgi:hypothetical protein
MGAPTQGPLTQAVTVGAQGSWDTISDLKGILQAAAAAALGDYGVPSGHKCSQKEVFYCASTAARSPGGCLFSLELRQHMTRACISGSVGCFSYEGHTAATDCLPGTECTVGQHERPAGCVSHLCHVSVNQGCICSQCTNRQTVHRLVTLHSPTAVDHGTIGLCKDLIANVGWCKQHAIHTHDALGPLQMGLHMHNKAQGMKDMTCQGVSSASH